MIVLSTLGILLLSYVLMGIITCFIKSGSVKLCAKIIEPIIAKEVSQEDLIAIEFIGLTLEKVCAMSIYWYCFSRWPEAIHSDIVAWATYMVYTPDLDKVEK